MVNIIWTPPTGWVEETGAHVSFTAPCDCVDADKLVIGENEYTIVDAMGNVVTGIGGVFAQGSIVELILNRENNKVYIENALTPTIDTYSTSEVKTNKVWINGKPIYRKVFQISLAGLSYSINTGLAGTVEQVTFLQGYVQAGGSTPGFITMPRSYKTSTYNSDIVYQLNGNIVIDSGVNYGGLNGYVIMEYTKV